MIVTFADTIDSIVDWLGTLDVAAWVLIGAGIALGTLTWLQFAGRSRLGSIEIETVKADDGSPLAVTAATAQLQNELGKVGLLPAGGVPAGSPTAALVAAIETAPVAQAAWIAKLIALLPIPATSRNFKISSTLRSDGAPGMKHGLTYSVVDVASKTCLCMETTWGVTPTKAVERAANDIYRTIVARAPEVFPSWARWASAEALDAYRKGLECEQPGVAMVKQRYQRALHHYLRASELDPKNVLARLRTGNSLERLAGCESLESADRPRLWAEALTAYVAVIVLHGEIFEPRYRASVVMGLVADHLDGPDEPTRRQQTRRQLDWAVTKLEDQETQVRRRLTSAVTTLEQWAARVLARLRKVGGWLRARIGMKPKPRAAPPADDPLAARLRECAQKQSRQARVRLRAHWTLWHEGRLRRQFEPKGTSRRQLRKALGISKMCLRVRRQWHSGDELPWRTAMLRLWWRFWLELRHFTFRSIWAGWQAHYNAAAFYALLPEASLEVRPTSVDQPGASVFDVNVRGPRLKAFKHLIVAIDDPDNELRPAYVRDEDPDLLVLREVETKRWDAAIERLAGPEVIVHYEREDRQYDLWTMRVALGRLVDRDPRWQDDDPVVHTRLDAWGSVFRIPIYDATKCIELRPMTEQGSGKDLWSFVPLECKKPEVWVRRGDPECYFSEPPPRAAAAP